MKVLITGATGLVGSAVARKLLSHGHEVVALCRKNSDRSLLAAEEKQIIWKEGDLLDVWVLEQVIREVDYVVHAAAIVSFAPKDRDAMYRINVEGTANVVNICLAAGIRKLCHISSNAALGRPDSRRQAAGEVVVITEDQRWEDSSANSYYSKTKYLAELEVWRGIAEGLNAVIVNPSVVLGEGDWTKSSTRLFRYVYQEKPFYTAGRMNYVDVKDVADAVVELIFSSVTAERFLLNAGSISYEAFFSLIADAFGKRRPYLKVGKLVAAIIWRVEMVRTWITRTTPLITRETAQSATRHYAYSNEKIRREIQLVFTPIEQTVARVCQSFRSTV